MNGFEEIIFSMYNKFNPDIKISLNEGKFFEYEKIKLTLENNKNIQLISPVFEDNAAIKNYDYQTVCVVKGVDSNYFEINGLKGQITQGEALLKENGVDFMVLGAGIDLKINANVGGPFSKVSLITPRKGDVSLTDASSISQMNIEPAGVIALDETINNKYVFVPIQFAQALFESENMVSSIEVKLKDSKQSNKVIETLKSQLGDDYKIQNRMEQQATLYKMFKSEKWASYAILTFILLIAAFNALGSLTMLVIEKKQDIKTLAGLGLRPNRLKSIFFMNGFLISGFGALIGLFIGIVLVVLQKEFGLIKMQGAIIDSYPVKLKLEDIVLVLSTVMVLGVLIGVYPASKSVKYMQSNAN